MAKTGLYNFTAECNKLLKHNPETKKKLHFLGYDNPELVKQKLKEIERK